MSVSVVIPTAESDKDYINRTVSNIYDTAKGEIEVIVVLNGFQMELDFRSVVVMLDENMGERVAMNEAVTIAECSHILRIDAHCDFTPNGWDIMMEEATGERDITQAVLTAVDKDWRRLKGHRYERCRLLPTMEAKWEKPNRDALEGIIPNMSSTGCGFMICKDFYWEVGGADEKMPPMGAIGEEFSVKAWMHGGKVQTHTGVTIGHIFGTGGYDTQGVLVAREMLTARYGDRYNEVREKFPDIEIENTIKLRPTTKQQDSRVVTVNRVDVTEFKTGGSLTGKRVATYKYIWLETDHPNEKDWTDDQIEKKYAPLAKYTGQETYILNDEGLMVNQETGDIESTTWTEGIHDHTRE